MIRMTHLAILFCMSLVVFAGPVALAGSNSPTGTWETSITGKVNGASLIGTAYIEFFEDGSCSGYAVVKQSDYDLSFSGSWTVVNKKLLGSLEVNISSSYSMVFDISGSASAGRSLSIKALGAASNQFKLSGKPIVAMLDVSGNYQGLIKTRGLTGLLTVDLGAPDPEMPGFYTISGDIFFIGSEIDLISGFALVKADGNFIAVIFNDRTGYSSSIWGKINTRGTISTSGLDLSNGSKIQVKFFDTPFFNS